MLSHRAATAPFDEAYWISRPLNLDLERGRTGTHDVYSIELPLADSQARTFDRAASALRHYRLFPPSRMRAHVTWNQMALCLRHID